MRRPFRAIVFWQRPLQKSQRRMRIHRTIPAMNEFLQLTAFAVPVHSDALPASFVILNGISRRIRSLHFIEVGVRPAADRFAHAYRILSVSRFDPAKSGLARSARALNVCAR